MNFLALARALHVLGVTLWIGGVWMVTTTLLSTRTFENEAQRAVAFTAVEQRFSRQARWLVALVGASGLYMVKALDAWQWFHSGIQFWWLHAMVCIWLVFALMLYVIEPLVLRRRQGHGHALRRMQILHVILLFASLLTIFGAVTGSHGGILNG